MKKSVPILERFLAVILVLAMVLSYVPAGAMAETSEQNPVVQLNAELVREKEELPVPSEEASNPAEAAVVNDTIQAEDTGDKIYVYNYTVKLVVNDETVDLKNENVQWFHADGTAVAVESQTPGSLTQMEQDDIYAHVTYDGITFALKLTDGDKCEFTIAPAEQPWSGSLVCGALFELKSGLKNEVISGLTHERQISENLTQKDNSYYAIQEGEITITDTWTSASGVIYAQKVYQAKAGIEYPAATITVNDQEVADGWYAAQQTVKVTVKNDMNLVSAAYLPGVTVGESVHSNWVNDGIGSFTMDIPVAKTETITYAKGTAVENSVTLNIDSFVPVAEIVRTYTRPGETEMIAGIYRVYTGESGLYSVTIGGQQIDNSNLQSSPSGENEPGFLKYIGFFEIPAVDAEQIEIAATSVAGLSSNSKSNGIMDVRFNTPNAAGLIHDEDGNITEYLVNGSQSMSFEVVNLQSGMNMTASAKDQDGNDIAIGLSMVNGIFGGKVPLTNGLSELVVIFTDPAAPEGQRETRYTFDGKYYLDKTAPTVTVKRDKVPFRVEQGTEGVTEYFNEAVNYIFTVNDEMWAKDEFAIEYTLAGEEEPRLAAYDETLGGYVINLVDGDNLTSVKVSGHDLTGNALAAVTVDNESNGLVWGEGMEIACDVKVDTSAPKVSAEISENVKMFYTNNGSDFAVLDMSDTTGEVVLTVSVEDKNLDVEALITDGWTVDAQNPAKYTKTFRTQIAENETGILSYQFAVKDMAGYMGDTVYVNAAGTGEDGYSTSLTMAPVEENGVKTATYQGTISIDRRPPSSVSTGTPVVTLTLKDTPAPITTEDGKKLFKDGFTYEMQVSDASEGGADSGMKKVTWELVDSVLFDSAEQIDAPIAINSNVDNNLDGSYEIVVTAKADVEAAATLAITLEDYAGNRFRYTEPFEVDTYAPRIDVVYDNEEQPQYVVGNTTFYNADRKAVITITDRNLNTSNIDTDVAVDGSTVTFTEGVHYLQVSAADVLGNDTVTDRENFIVDTTAPAIKLELIHKDTVSEYKAVKTIGDVDYFNAEGILRVTISDIYLNADASAVPVAELKYSTEAGEEVVTLGQESGWTLTTLEDGTEAYVYNIALDNNAVLTAVSVSARDNANNSAAAENVSCSENLNLGLVYNPDENAYLSTRVLVVDTQAPEVVVNKQVAENRYIQSFEGNAYYNAPVTYTVNITDNFLDLTEEAGSIVVLANYADGNEAQTVKAVEVSPEALKSALDTYTAEFTVEDGKKLDSITIKVHDNVGNVSKEVVVQINGVDGNAEAVETNESKLSTVFVYNDENGYLRYDGQPVIVDQTKPVVTLAFSENVTGFYRNGNTFYLLLNESINMESGSQLPANAEKATVTITAKDMNLTLAENINGLKHGENTPAWSGEYGVNTDSTVTLVAESIAVGANQVAVFHLDATVIDLAGNYPDNIDVVVNNNVDEITPDKGHIDCNFTVDRRAPSSSEAEIPVIEITPSINPVKAADGEKDLFGASFDYTLNVSDSASGLHQLTWSVTDKNNVVAGASGTYRNEDGTIDQSIFTTDENGAVSCAIPVQIMKAEDGKEIPGESNDVIIDITAVDNLGNTIHFKKVIGVDNMAPRVVVDDLKNKPYTQVNGIYYYNADLDITVTVEDLNFDGSASIIDVKPEAVVTVPDWSDLKDNKYGLTLKYRDDNDYTLAMESKDLLGNPAEINIAPELSAFTMDQTNPVIDLKIVKNDGNVDDELRAVFEDNDDSVDYFNAPFTILVTVSDHNLNRIDANAVSANPDVPVATLIYTTEAGGETKIELNNVDENSWMFEQDDQNGNEIYTYAIPLADYDVLTSVSVAARDNANNIAGEKNVTCAENLNLGMANEEGSLEHKSTRAKVVDTTAPVVVVNKEVASKSYIQTFEGNAYYNAPVTYKVQVSDSFLKLAEGAGSIKITATVIDDKGAESVVEFAPVVPEAGSEQTEAARKHSDPDVYNYTYTVENGIVLKNIDIKVNDNVQHVPESILVNVIDLGSAAENSNVEHSAVHNTKLITAFKTEDEGATWFYSGERVIVDTTKPVVTVQASQNVAGFYQNNNVIYLILKDPIQIQSGSNSTAAAEKVSVTFTVEDRNMTLLDNTYGLKNLDASSASKWIGQPLTNQSSTASLTIESADVNVDHVVAFTVDANIFDLAGNGFAAFEYKVARGNGFDVAAFEENDGHLNRTFAVDRRTPSSFDNNAPTIEITPSITPTKTADGKDLFNGDFHFDLTVTDGVEANLNAGLKDVYWKVSDKNGVVEEVAHDVDNEFPEWTRKKEYDIPVNIKNIGESNDVEIYIRAEDNVGNVIEYTQTIGADNMLPRVTIVSSGDEFTHPNNKYYYNKDLNIAVTVEDLNFDGSASLIHINPANLVHVPGWSDLGGNKHDLNLRFHTDNDYTLAVESTDLANNKVTTENGTIEIDAWESAFTMDQTAPVIHVEYNPSMPVGTDNAGVQYFDKDRTTTITIDEHNFNSNEVRYEGNVSALGGWSSRSDRHSASAIYREGNNYHFTVNYTDLAGNPAQSYVSPNFSVDLHAPTITMTSGNLDLNELNIIPDDLTLGFTIHDEQKNMVEKIEVEVLFVDRNNHERVVEGVEYYTVTDADDRTTGYVNFANIEKIKENDGIYTVRITARDYAGHVTTLVPELVMSLNRFGSSFMIEDEYTKEFLTPNSNGVVYHKDVANDLVIKEINPNQVWQNADKKVIGSMISIAVNGKTINLQKDVDYSVTENEKKNGQQKWYEYTYTIYADVFTDNGTLVDGEYTMFFYSEDEAGNRNSSETNVDSLLQKEKDGNYSGKINFVLDHQKPVITILGIKNGKPYYEANRKVEINVSDNTPTVIEIYVNDKLVERVELSDGKPVESDWFYQDENDGNYYLNLSGKKQRQNVKVVIEDAAGNISESVISDVMLTDDLFAQYINSTPALLITLVLLVILVVLIMVLVKKRKKEPQEATTVS